MFQGWASFSGVEVINQARTVKYARTLMNGVQVSDCGGCEDLAEVLGDKEYTTPFVDQPDWFDPNNPDTWGFAGFLPLSVEGVEDSTRTAAVTQLATDGAYASAPRAAGREMRFSGLLLGVDDAAVQSGMTWLRHVLEGDYCRSSGGCTGDHLCYFAACPVICEDSPNLDDLTPTYLCPSGEEAPLVESCIAPYERHLYRVTALDGPVVTQEYNLDCGAMWEVEFTLMAGVPDAYGSPQWVGCVDRDTGTSIIVDDQDCEPGTGLPPIQDPACVVPLPPRPPLVLDDCLTEPPRWRRYQYDIEEGYIPSWSDAVPTIRLRTGAYSANQIRLRFYPNPFGRDVTNINGGCDFCGEFLISYVPRNSLLVIDGVQRQAYIETYDGGIAQQQGASRMTATHLLYGSDGGPMSWPLLSCGNPYSMTVDVVPDRITEMGVCLCLNIRE